MRFPEALRKATEHEYAEWEAAKNLSEEERRRKYSHHVRVNAKYMEDLRKELRSGSITWYADASKTVGGKGEYPGALQQFLAGLPLCQMSHYAERASVGGLKIDDLEISVTGQFVAISGYGFDEIEYEARILSEEPPEKIRELATAATNDCYVTNTLKRACNVKGHVFLNGQPLFDIS